MSPLFIYLLKASATVFLLWAFYTLCLRRMTFHRLNRYFFLTGILVSILWPFLPLTEWLSKAPQVSQVVVYIPVSAFMMQFKPEAPVFGVEMAFKIAYFAGVLFMVVRLAIQIFSLLVVYKKSKIQVINDVTVHVVNGKINPFSFFGYIFLNPSNHTPAELSAIILHEKVHETSTHSVDILLSEFLKILLWFNPFSWLFCRAVKENIEFEVDRVLLHNGVDCKEYQYSLLKLSTIKNQNPITNHFNLSNLKSRIIMMNKNQSSRYGLAAYALVIPIILLCMVFSYAIAQEKPAKADATKQAINIKQKVENVPDKALILLDGKIIDKSKMDVVNPNDIYSVNVLKGKDATDIYGKKGENGVVLITSKNKDSVSNSATTIHLGDSTGMVKFFLPIYIVDGVQMNDIKGIDKDQIESISVIKNGNAKSLYGEKGRNGVILITTKKYKNIKSGDGNEDSNSTTISISGDRKGDKTTSDLTTSYSKDGRKIVTTNRYFVRGTDTASVTHDTQEILRIHADAADAFKSIPDNAIYLLNGKVPSKAEMLALKPEEIESIEVLKGDAATALFGKKYEEGVIVISTKKK